MTFQVLLMVALLSAAPEENAHPNAVRSLIPLSIGAALLVTGGIFLGISVGQTEQAGRLDPEPGAQLLFTATSNRVGGVMLLTTGVLVTGIAAFLFWFVPTAKVSVSLTPLSGGALLSFGWQTL